MTADGGRQIIGGSGTSGYHSPAYDSKARFGSYWHQIQEVLPLRPESVLEIGIGNGFVSDYLRKRGVAVTTLDIDPRLDADLVASTTAIPLSRNTFDIVVCCEVLEHLPFESLSDAMREIHRITTRRAVLSIPDCTRTCGFEIWIPWARRRQILLQLPYLRPPGHQATITHKWEIGTAGYPLQAVQECIRRAGFQIRTTYRVFENPYHRFFVLTPAEIDSDRATVPRLANQEHEDLGPA